MGTKIGVISTEPRETVHPHRNDVQQFTTIFARSMPFFYRIALNRLGNMADAEDAIQDAFLSAFTHMDQFKGQARLSTWLAAIVINSARMKRRQRPRQLHISMAGDDREQENHPFSEILSDGRPTPEEMYQRRELLERMVELSKHLSPPLRRSFQIRDVYGLSVRETAQLLGLQEGTVKAQVVRARAKLAKLMRMSRHQKAPELAPGRDNAKQKSHSGDWGIENSIGSRRAPPGLLEEDFK
jgi:RNA polymerase sigma-70 factor (ECF subfamily)